DAIGPWRADQLRESRAPCAHFGAPVVPRVAELRVPMGQSFAEIFACRVERAAERVIGEIDAVTMRRQHAGEKWNHVIAHGVFCQRTLAERRKTVRYGRFHRRLSAPMTVRTSINSGKNS